MFLGNNNNNDIIEDFNPFKKIAEARKRMEAKKREEALKRLKKKREEALKILKLKMEEKERRAAIERAAAARSAVARIRESMTAVKSCPALNDKMKMGYREGTESMKEIKNVPNAAACRMHTIDAGGKAFIYRNYKHPVKNLKKTCVVLKNYPTSGNFVGQNEHHSGCANWMKDIDKGCK